MYLCYVDTNDELVNSSKAGRCELNIMPLETRINNALLNFGINKTTHGFGILSKLIYERVLDDPKLKGTSISGDLGAKASYAVKSAFANTHLVLEPSLFPVIPKTKAFVDTIAEFLKNNEDFKWYFQTLQKDCTTYIATSLNEPICYINCNPMYMGINTRIEQLLNNVGITSKTSLQSWSCLIGQAYSGRYTNIASFTKQTGICYITFYQQLSRSFKDMVESPNYSKILQQATLSAIPSCEFRIDSTLLIFASYLRRNLDALWYL